jgi:LTXXQ motif family protein
MARPDSRRPNIARTPDRVAPSRIAPSRLARPDARPSSPAGATRIPDTAGKPAAQNPAANNARQAAQERRQQLQQKLRQGNVSRAERREFRTLGRQERNATVQDRRLNNAEQRLDRLQSLQTSGTRLGRAQQRELQRLQNTPQLRERLQARQQQLAPNQQTRQLGTGQRADRRAARVTQQQVQSGRFAAQYLGAGARDNRGARRALALIARAAWQRGAYARYVPWRSGVYWPYAYTDVFHYTFWPEAYEPAYWATAYDDLFDGVFFPDGAPYVEYADESPYEGPYARATTGSAPAREGRVRETARQIPGQLSQQARQVCSEPDKGVAAWPFDKIGEAVRPSADQKALLEQMELAAGQAADRLKQACPENLPMTPGGRLQAMTLRLQGTLDAVKLVRPPLEKFYESLSDEQRARFNELGPEIGRNDKRAATSQPGDCGGEKSGLSAIAIDRIEDIVQPTDAQLSALDKLSEALGKAVETLQTACPTTVATTPVGRLETMQQRLEAMIDAANTVRPPLEDFYASLSNEQKAKFNRLSRQTAQAN